MKGEPEMKSREMKKLKITTKKKKIIKIKAERNDQMKEKDVSEVQYLMKPPKQRAQRVRARGRATKGGKKYTHTHTHTYTHTQKHKNKDEKQRP